MALLWAEQQAIQRTLEAALILALMQARAKGLYVEHAAESFERILREHGFQARVIP